MAVIKGCPRCKGTLIIDRDHHGWYEHCLQCGYQKDLDGIEQERTLVEEKARGLNGSPVWRSGG